MLLTLPHIKLSVFDHLIEVFDFSIISQLGFIIESCILSELLIVVIANMFLEVETGLSLHVTFKFVLIASVCNNFQLPCGLFCI